MSSEVMPPSRTDSAPKQNQAPNKVADPMQSHPFPKEGHDAPTDHSSTGFFQKKNWKWLGIVLIALVGVFLLTRKDSAPKPEAKAPEVPIQTATAEKGDVGVYVEALGTVTPITSVSVVSRVQGQIMSVNYKEGQMVKKGDSLVEIDSGPYQAALAQAQGQYAKDIAMLKAASNDVVRYRQAYRKQAISKQQLDDQEQLVLQDQGVVKSDEGALDNAKINLSYCHIRSPIDGRVGLRLIDQGNMVQANGTAPLVQITQISPISVVFTVAEDHLDQIQAQVQQKHTMEVDAYDRSHQKKLAIGTFLTLDNTIDPATGTVKVKALFDNADGMLFPNQFVNARLLLDTERNDTLIVTSAIQRNAKGPFVYVIGEDKTAKVRNIKLGTNDENKTAVDGLQAGEMVASAGFDKLQDGAKVKIQTSGEANKNGEVMTAQKGDQDSGASKVAAQPAKPSDTTVITTTQSSAEPVASPAASPSASPKSNSGKSSLNETGISNTSKADSGAK